MVGRGGAERALERIAHAFGGLLDILWSLPAAARLNRAPIASIAVLALAGLAFTVGNGGLGVPQAARAVPLIDAPGSGGEPTASPTPSPLPSTQAGVPVTPEITFQPVGGGSSSPGRAIDGSAPPAPSTGD
jgi:hypothetical protein